MRSASQLERGNLETDLAALYLTTGPKKPEVTVAKEKQLLRILANGEPSQMQNVIDIAEFNKHRLSPAEIRENWEQKLDEYNSDITATGSSPDVNLPKATINVDRETHSDEPPVVVQTITFVDANQVIPLNWKLSNRQKRGYLLAWDLCSSEGTPLRETLDRYFNRASK